MENFTFSDVIIKTVVVLPWRKCLSHIYLNVSKLQNVVDVNSRPGVKYPSQLFKMWILIEESVMVSELQYIHISVLGTSYSTMIC